MMGGANESYQVMRYIKNKQIETVLTKVALKDLTAAIDRVTKGVSVGELLVTR